MIVSDLDKLYFYINIYNRLQGPISSTIIDTITKINTTNKTSVMIEKGPPKCDRKLFIAIKHVQTSI